MKSNRRDIIIAGLGIGTGITGTLITASKTQNFSMDSDDKQLAIKVGSLKDGSVIAFEWSGYSFYILKRTPAMLDSLTVIEKDLKDPESEGSIQPENCLNRHRSIKEDILVIYNLCTRVGHPLQVNNNPEKEYLENVGFYCPLDGSRYDFAGRSLKGNPGGPNLYVPHYYFKDDQTLVIEKDILKI